MTSPQTSSKVRTFDIGFVPRKWQDTAIKLFTSKVRYVTLVVHRRAGKTHLAAAKLITHAINKTGLYAYILPETTQFKVVAWPVLKHYVQCFLNVELDGKVQNLVKINESELTITFWNGSIIKPFSGQYGDSIRGTKLAGAVFDEVAQIPNETWEECVEPALSDTPDSWALFIGTPKGINLFSELYDRGQDPNLPSYASMRFDCYQTDALPPERIEELRRTVSDNAFRREYLCDFSASTEDQLLSVEDVETAMQRYADNRFISQGFSPQGRANVFMGVDVSRFGDDCSVIFVRSYNRAELVYMQRGKDTVTLTDAVVQMVRRYKPDAVYIDGTGVGGGVVDQVRACRVECFDINFGQKSTDPQYKNKRTEMWARMADWLKTRGCISPDLRDLKIDLPAPLYKKDDNGVMSLEKKEEIKKRIGHSPDLGDALALTFGNLIPEFDTPEQIKISRAYMHVKPAPLTPIERYEKQVHDGAIRQPQRYY